MLSQSEEKCTGLFLNCAEISTVTVDFRIIEHSVGAKEKAQLRV